MRMRIAAPILTSIALAMLGGLVQSNVLAAPSVSPSPPAPTPSRAPIGAPPAANSDEINSAYEFRNRMSSDPACQELARRSDGVYSDANLDGNEKQQALQQLRSQAQAAGCL